MNFVSELPALKLIYIYNTIDVLQSGHDLLCNACRCINLIELRYICEIKQKC